MRRERERERDKTQNNNVLLDSHRWKRQMKVLPNWQHNNEFDFLGYACVHFLSSLSFHLHFFPFICHNFSTSYIENSIRLLKGARFICVSVKNSILKWWESEKTFWWWQRWITGHQHFQITTQTKCKKIRARARAHFISIEIVSNPQNIHVLTSKFHCSAVSTQTHINQCPRSSFSLSSCFWTILLGCLESSEKIRYGVVEMLELKINSRCCKWKIGKERWRQQRRPNSRREHTKWVDGKKLIIKDC